MTRDEEDQIFRLYHASYLSMKKPMRKIEKETGMSGSTIRKRWRSMRLPSIHSLARTDPEIRRRLFGNRHGANRTDDFANIATHEAVPYTGSPCAVCEKVHP